MSVTVDPEVAPFYNVTFVLCGLVFCNRCGAEVIYASPHPAYTDENYYDQAVLMRAGGWSVVPGTVDADCPACVAGVSGVTGPQRFSPA